MDNDLLKKLQGICNSLSTDELCHELNKVSSVWEGWDLESTEKILNELRHIANLYEYEIERKLKEIMKHHYDNKDIVIKCALIDGSIIDQASKRLLNDIDVARAAVLLSMDIPNDDSTDRYAFKQLSDELKDNKDFVLQAIKNNKSIIELVSQNLINDKDVVIAAGSCGLKVTETLKNDREVLIAIAKKDPWFLSEATPDVRKDIEIVCICCRLRPEVIKYAHTDLIAELITMLYEKTKKNQKYIKKRSIKSG